MKNKKRRHTKAYQGFTFSFELSNETLVWKFCRLIPLARIKLNDIDHLRSSFFDEVFPGIKTLHRFIQNRYWFSSIPRNDRKFSPLYVIETHHRHRKIFLKLESSFHYRIRSALGRIKSRDF